MIDTNNGWIKCSDRLPPEGELVIVTILEHRIEFYSKVENGQWLHEYGDGISISAPTHWRFIVAPAPVDDGWIKCSDRLPEPETPVLILVNGVQRVGEIRWDRPSHEETYEPFRYWDDPENEGQPWECFDITHWRLLPSLPLGSLDH